MLIDAQTELLLKKSDQDRTCLNYPLPSENFGFDAQQAVEKLLKALISAHGKSYPYTHDLEKLQTQLINLGEEFPDHLYDFTEMQPYAALLRYDNTKDLSEAERQRFRDTVDALRAFVLERVAALSA